MLRSITPANRTLFKCALRSVLAIPRAEASGNTPEDGSVRAGGGSFAAREQAMEAQWARKEDARQVEAYKLHLKKVREHKEALKRTVESLERDEQETEDLIKQSNTDGQDGDKRSSNQWNKNEQEKGRQYQSSDKNKRKH
ncbi:unnamed protein product [Didymodactylos carnosus]|uniref:Mitochondrial ATPase inhibitor n=1 Tax=Didymodactylos carnosus TaxID=1234261 RepID=A0A815PKL3_9BILA|nr:unnamed protein product [Didymodactylos carnosus]CAF1450178.1 unnamed protein product [Didymodactylos carnosus]CAF4070875.1 unnamed protein product [Didymodactylos carnosus]CAF4323726.1 unnamed protein product [Didymodactylos carnosus]